MVNTVRNVYVNIHSTPLHIH